jgi:hypothetical protein
MECAVVNKVLVFILGGPGLSSDLWWGRDLCGFSIAYYGIYVTGFVGYSLV